MDGVSFDHLNNITSCPVGFTGIFHVFTSKLLSFCIISINLPIAREHVILELRISSLYSFLQINLSCTFYNHGSVLQAFKLLSIFQWLRLWKMDAVQKKMELLPNAERNLCHLEDD